MQSCCHDVILPSPRHRHPAPAWLPCTVSRLRSPGRGFVRFQLTRSRQLRSGWLVRAAAGCWGGLSTVSMNIQFHLATCHLHKSHITNSKQFCLNCSIKVTLRVPQLVSSPQFCDINLNIHSGYISTQYGDGAPVPRFPCPLCAMTDEAVMDGAALCSLQPAARAHRLLRVIGNR